MPKTHVRKSANRKKASARRLTEQEKQRIKNYFIALFTIKDSPKRVQEMGLPKDDWSAESLTENFRKLFYSTSKAYHKLIRKHGSPSDEMRAEFIENHDDYGKHHKGIQAGLNICYDLLSTGITNWGQIENDVYEIVENVANAKNTYNIDDIMAHGPSRMKILTRFKYDDIMEYYGGISNIQQNNDAKLDILMLLNDHSSTLFKDMLVFVSNNKLKQVNELIKLEADIINKNGHKTGTMKFNINTVTPSGANIVFYALYDANSIERVKFALDIIKSFDNVLVNIPYHFSNGPIQTSFSLTLMNYMHNHNTELNWEIIKTVLEKQPIKNMYINDKTTKIPKNVYGSVYGVILSENAELIPINNVLIARWFPLDKFRYLVDKGLDLSMAGDDGSTNLRIALERMHDKQQVAITSLQNDLNSKKKLVNQKQKELNDAKQQETKLEQMISKTILAAKRTLATQTRLQPLFEEFGIRGGRRKSK